MASKNDQNFIAFCDEQIYGSWFMVHGSWFMVNGSWLMVHFWIMVHG